MVLLCTLIVCAVADVLSDGGTRLETYRRRMPDPSATTLGCNLRERRPSLLAWRKRLNHRSAEMGSMRIPKTVEKWWWERRSSNQSDVPSEAKKGEQQQQDERTVQHL